MKKHFTLLALVIFSISAFAQTYLPNSDFEAWTPKSGYNQLNGWTTPDSITIALDGKHPEVLKSSNSYTGSFAAALITTLDTFYSIEPYTVPGFVLLGQINILSQSITGGVPFTGRPDSLYGYCEYFPVQKDSALAYLLLTRWNPSKGANGGRDTVGEGGILIFDTISSYGRFNIPITYLTNEVPDTIQLAISSSFKILNNPPIGSTLFVDDLYFSADTSSTSGISLLADKGFSISCYPNPANTNLNILISEPQQGMMIKVYDILGKNLFDVNTEGLITSINVGQLSNGTYLYEVLDKSGNSLKTEKFNIVR